jgi:hypothetical protein
VIARPSLASAATRPGWQRAGRDAAHALHLLCSWSNFKSAPGIIKSSREATLGDAAPRQPDPPRGKPRERAAAAQPSNWEVLRRQGRAPIAKGCVSRAPLIHRTFDMRQQLKPPKLKISTAGSRIGPDGTFNG